MSVPITSDDASSAIADLLRAISVGALFAAAVSTFVASVKSIEPDPTDTTSASPAVFN